MGSANSVLKQTNPNKLLPPKSLSHALERDSLEYHKRKCISALVISVQPKLNAININLSPKTPKRPSIRNLDPDPNPKQKNLNSKLLSIISTEPIPDAPPFQVHKVSLNSFSFQTLSEDEDYGQWDRRGLCSQWMIDFPFPITKVRDIKIDYMCKYNPDTR